MRLVGYYYKLMLGIMVRQVVEVYAHLKRGL